MLGLAVAAMTSCSNDELMEVNTNNVITFESHVDKGTRAVTNTTTAGLTKFYVFGNYGTTNVLTNVAVTKNGETWEYDNPVPWTANTYNFAAYATKNESAQITPAYNNGVLTFSNVVANDANDIVAATATANNQKLDNNAVALTFKHLLSKVQFTLTNAATENYKMKVSDITFSAQNQGDCVFNGTASWTPEGTAESLTFDGTTENVAKAASFASEDHIVIPNQTIVDTKGDSDPNNDVNVITASFKVEFYDATDNKVYEKEYTGVSLKLDDAGSKWQPGYIYNYRANVTSTTSYIQFTVTKVEDWVPADAGVDL